MKAIRTTMVVAVVCIMLPFLTILQSSDTSGQSDGASTNSSVVMYNDNGRVIDRIYLQDAEAHYDTYTDHTGNKKYLMKIHIGTDTLPSSLMIQAGGGRFNLDVGIDLSRRALSDTITLTVGDGQATLSSSNGYYSSLYTGISKTVYNANEMQSITITTLSNSYDFVKDMVFYISGCDGTHLVRFTSDGKVYATYVIETGQAFGTLPSPQEPGRSFDGWYDDDENRITSDTVYTYNSDIVPHAMWGIGGNIDPVWILIDILIGLSAYLIYTARGGGS